MLVELSNHTLGLRLARQRAESWRLLIPLPEWRGHYVSGKGQPLRDLQVDDGVLRLAWGPIESDAVGTLDISVTMEVWSSDGDIHFRTEVANRSSLVIEELMAPFIAGICVPPDREAWRVVGPHEMTGAFEYPVFDTAPCSLHGPQRAVVLHPYPGGPTHQLSLGMPWLLLEHTDGRGLYIANRSDDLAFSCALLEFDSELRIDTSATASVGDIAPQRWPVRPGPDSTLGLTWTSFPFAGPHETYTGPDIALRWMSGGWREAAEHFREDLGTRVGPIPRRTTWISQSDAWLVTAMSNNDGTIRHRASDLPRVASEAAESGITAIVLMGWSVGALGDFADSALDPRLGTEDEFRRALVECREHGVRVVLMAPIQQVCAETDWFRDEGHQYVVRNPNGDPFDAAGAHHGVNAILDQLSYAAPRILTANPAHDGFRAQVMAQLSRIVGYGADGVLLGRLHTGDPFSLDYNPDLPGTPATRFHRGLGQALRDLADQVAVSEDFAVMGEYAWDRAMPYCEASFSRHLARSHLPVQEVVFPDVRVCTRVVGDTDRQMVNNALRNGHAVCLEPRSAHGDVASMPNLGVYVADVLGLRRHLWDLLWEGRAADPSDAIIRGDDVLHGVFHAPPDGAGRVRRRTAVVLCHFEEMPRRAWVELPGTVAIKAMLYRPFREPERIVLPADIVVHSGEYAVVVTT